MSTCRFEPGLAARQIEVELKPSHVDARQRQPLHIALAQQELRAEQRQPSLRLGEVLRVEGEVGEQGQRSVHHDIARRLGRQVRELEVFGAQLERLARGGVVGRVEVSPHEPRPHVDAQREQVRKDGQRLDAQRLDL